MHAAAALRLAYSQGLETLLALLCAAMQAPDCVVGWMQSYRDSDLQEHGEIRLVNSSANRLARLQAGHLGFSGEVRALGGWLGRGEGARLAQGFGRLWSRFAGDYLDELAGKSTTRSSTALGLVLVAFSWPSACSPPRGSRPSRSDALNGRQRVRLDVLRRGPTRRRQAALSTKICRNWSPQSLIDGLGLLAMSIQNATSFLRWVNGEPGEECRYDAPIEEAAFDLPWAQHCGVTSSSIDTTIVAEHVNLWTKDEVLTALRRRYELPSP